MTLHALLDLPAPGKLNLFLHVVGRRDDGYHLLQSVFVLIDWFDRLHFERRDDGRLVRHDLGEPLPQDDLCLRAARLLQQASGCRLGADISIDKRLPQQAGLGGGSSDAATTLLALRRLWGLNLGREELLRLATRLGADVPFFVGGDNAFVEGIGERLTPIAVPQTWYAIVKPPVGLTTADIFASPALRRDSEPVILSGSLADASGSGFGCGVASAASAVVGGRPVSVVDGFGRNDLQPVAEQSSDEVARVVAWLQDRFGNSRMTGSGSSVFSRVGTGDQPMATFPVGELPPGWVGRMCRSLDHHPLRGWAG